MARGHFCSCSSRHAAPCCGGRPSTSADLNVSVTPARASHVSVDTVVVSVDAAAVFERIPFDA